MAAAKRHLESEPHGCRRGRCRLCEARPARNRRQEAVFDPVFPKTKTLISFVMRMNRENIRTPARSISNLEFHHATDEANEVARRIVSALEKIGITATNGGAAGFPMEADRWGSLEKSFN